MTVNRSDMMKSREYFNKYITALNKHAKLTGGVMSAGKRRRKRAGALLGGPYPMLSAGRRRRTVMQGGVSSGGTNPKYLKRGVRQHNHRKMGYYRGKNGKNYYYKINDPMSRHRAKFKALSRE